MKGLVPPDEDTGFSGREDPLRGCERKDVSGLREILGAVLAKGGEGTARLEMMKI